MAAVQHGGPGVRRLAGNEGSLHLRSRMAAPAGNRCVLASPGQIDTLTDASDSPRENIDGLYCSAQASSSGKLAPMRWLHVKLQNTPMHSVSACHIYSILWQLFRALRAPTDCVQHALAIQPLVVADLLHLDWN